MKSFITLISLFFLLAVTTALPVAVFPRSDFVAITLHGATPDAQYCLAVPYNTYTETWNGLSISSVDYDHSDTSCKFYGVDQETAPPVEANGQLGPPQTIMGLECWLVSKI